MDFVRIKHIPSKDNSFETLIPTFNVSGHNKDIMIRGGNFYAIFDEETGLWSKNKYDCQRLIDKQLYSEKTNAGSAIRLTSENYDSGVWKKFCEFCKMSPDNYHELDKKVIFSDTELTRDSYASFKLPYKLSNTEPFYYNKLMNTLYSPSERSKLEWGLGAILCGDGSKISKFFVLYGAPGTGKSTWIDIACKIFSGYVNMFDAEALGNSSNRFAMEPFKDNPIIAIQHDADLSRIDSNVRLNSIVSHEPMAIEEKHKSQYLIKPEAVLFIGSNKPVKITDSKSGLLRRLIDVRPTGKTFKIDEYNEIMENIDFEIGSIANKCIEVYSDFGRRYYSNYVPQDMMADTNVFYDFMSENYLTFKRQNCVTLSKAKELYFSYMKDNNLTYTMKPGEIREELKSYFQEFHPISTIDGSSCRNVYRGFKSELFDFSSYEPVKSKNKKLELKETKSILDELYSNLPAQYAKEDGTPKNYWKDVTTTLKDIDSKKVHYIKVPQNHIIIDFDLKDSNGEKSLEANLLAASSWPSTYAELSKSGKGVHLHYIYEGDATKLSNIYSEGIEIKVYTGNSSLRRKLTLCNDVGLSIISSGLPLKEEKMVKNIDIEDEEHLINKIKKALRKEIHSSTKCNVDYICETLDIAYKTGMKYDVSTLKKDCLEFANNSTNNASYCVKKILAAPFKSKDEIKSFDLEKGSIIFFDVEVFPNLFIFCGMKEEDSEPSIRLVNPTPEDISDLLKMKLIGFNCRRYDNHICYARKLGYSNKELYLLSQDIIKNKNDRRLFGSAYNLSYTDVYDFASAANKKSLKRFEIELGIHHQELEFSFDEDCPEERIEEAVRYCCNDVKATKETFLHLSEDWKTRQILAEISGLSVNDTTNAHTTKIIFGDDKNPQKYFNFPDISKEFPGYEYVDGKNMYRGIDLGKGGYVYSEPGMYGNVALLDVKSMHPHSIIALNLFGKYTKNFADLVEARVAIKEERYDDVRKMFDGKLSKYLTDKATAKILSTSLKTPINSVYGLTSASFDNPFHDKRNFNNIVALRGALFMKTLQDEVAARGFTVAHIKTDSIKIPDATEEIIDFCMNFAKKYGYEFDYEDNYNKMCLVNKAVYIAKSSKDKKWHATGAEFAHPYIFKTLFSHESLVFEDYCEIKEVKGTSIYLHINNDYIFIGRIGSFIPVIDGGGELYRKNGEKYDNVQGCMGYMWQESENVKINNMYNKIDMRYYRKIADDAIASIKEFGDYDWFVSDDEYIGVYLNKNIVV